jgi:uncharacterized RDD family membrane protein YckC
MLDGIMPTNAPSAPPGPPPPFAALGWRLLAMLYDSLPLLALWLLASALVLLLRGGVPVPPWSLAFWLQALALWLVAGAYFALSWQRGGQTLGMRPWRLRLLAVDGRPVTASAAWRRYLLATLSLAPAGLGFWWALLDPERRCLHDIGSTTRVLRLPKP